MQTCKPMVASDERSINVIGNNGAQILHYIVGFVTVPRGASRFGLSKAIPDAVTLAGGTAIRARVGSG